MTTIQVGVAGYDEIKFDEQLGRQIIGRTFDEIVQRFPDQNIAIISGLTALGIPKLAYEEAVRRGWRTVGIACQRATEYPLFPVDEQKIVGNEWGDESETFISSIDLLIRIGNGRQSVRESEIAQRLNKPVLEYDLPPL